MSLTEGAEPIILTKNVNSHFLEEICLLGMEALELKMTLFIPQMSAMNNHPNMLQT